MRPTNNADATPAVRAWASYVVASLSSQDARTDLVRRMCSDPQWPVRMLGVLTAESLSDADTWISAVAAGDADPNVKALAQAHLDEEAYEKANPATQPSGDVSSVGTGPAITPSDSTPKPDAPAAP